MTELVDAFEPGELATIFSTTSLSHAQDRYFLESGDRIRFFFEEDALDEHGRLRQAKALSINEVGHALHDLDPTFERFSRRPALAALLADLGMPEPLLRQSMYIFKQPRIGGEVVCHQDAASCIPSPRAWLACGSRSRTRRSRTAACRSARRSPRALAHALRPAGR